MDSKKIENAFVEVIEALGEVQYKEELKDTPKRIADSYKEIFYGIGINPKEVLKRTFEVNSDELIIEKNIDFYSMCEHHFLPFFGTICIAYIPNKKIFGFGDILKLIEILSRRPQLQERLTEEIAKYIKDIFGKMVKSILKEVEVSGIFLTGGDTAISIIKNLEVEELEILLELSVGTVLLKITEGKYKELPIITKAGSFGDEKILYESMIKIKEGIL